jgi:ATP-dependent Clp protease ATP-binding subunit ClpA/ATP-dependent Clp protease ATP-binding subunit ClpC
MTSNLGARTRAPVGFADESEAAEAEREVAAQHDHLEAVRAFFAPELFNRIDRVVPFRPLSRGSARAIVAKELAKLLARRGLVDRHVFVTTEPGVVDRVVREAFRAADGARSLKRWLEDAIGTRLTEHLVASPPATMQLVELRDGERGIEVHAEPLREREPVDATWSLERLEKLPVVDLERHVAGEVRFLEDLAAGPELERLSEEIRHHLRQHGLGRRDSADQLFNLEAMRTQVIDFGARMDGLARACRGDTSDEIELTSLGYAALARDGHVQRVRLFDRRSTVFSQPRPVRAELLECIAESAFLRRSLLRVRDPAQHAAFIELYRVGDPAKAGRFGSAELGLFEWLAHAYADARGECHGVALRTRDGRVVEGGSDDLGAIIATGARHVVIKQVGLAVLDFFELETGSHLRHSMSGSPEIVRVRVVPAAADRSAASLLEEPLDQRLLPAVRTIRFDPSRRPGGTSALALEDYAMAVTLDLQVREIRDALDRLWRIRMSREEA